MLYALRFFDTERSLWYLDCVHRSKQFLKRREKKFLKRGIKTRISKWYGIQCLTAFEHIKDISMKISDLVKSLDKIKAKHGDLPIAFEISDDDCCPIKKLHVTKVYDDDSTVS